MWSLYRRCAPSREWPMDHHRGVEGADGLMELLARTISVATRELRADEHLAVIAPRWEKEKV